MKDEPSQAYWQRLREKNKVPDKDKEQDRAKVLERIDRLQKELKRAQELGNEAEVREIQEQLRRLEAVKKAAER